MTMPQGSTEEPQVVLTEREAVPVHVVSTSAKPGKTAPPEFGQFKTYVVSNTVNATSVTPGAQRIISRSLRRHRCNILINATVTGQPSTDGVIIGSRDEINSGNPMVIGSVGGYLQIGDNVRYEAQRELWVAYPASNTDAVYVTVCDELYASDPDAWREEQQ
jgi:hypothetical protein